METTQNINQPEILFTIDSCFSMKFKYKGRIYYC